MTGEATFAIAHAEIIPAFLTFVEATPFLYASHAIYVTRRPQPIVNYINILMPFSIGVWAIFLGLLLLLAICFVCIYQCYKENMKMHELVRPYIDYPDFFLKTFFAFAEPNPLNWFTKMSAGNFHLNILILRYKFYEL